MDREGLERAAVEAESFLSDLVREYGGCYECYVRRHGSMKP